MSALSPVESLAPEDLYNHYSLDQFIEHLSTHFDTTSPLIDIPTPLHLFRKFVAQIPDTHCLVWPDVVNHAYVKYSYKQVWDLSGRLLGHLHETFLLDIPAKSVIAVLCDDNPGLFLLLLALYRGGYVTLLVSSRNSAAAVKSLVLEADASVLITSNMSLAPILTPAEKAIRICEYSPISPEMLYKLPQRESLYEPPSIQGGDAMEEICHIIHSSGTSRFPTLVKISHRYIYVNGLAVHGWSKCNDPFTALNIGPLFHAMTFNATFCATLCGATPACFPLTAASVPKPSEIMQSIQLLAPHKLNLVPVMLQLLCDHADADATGSSWRQLEEISSISFGGAPLSSVLDKRLRDHNLNVSSNYGSTEAGCILGGMGRPRGPPYSVMTFMPEVSYEMRPSETCPGTYELFIARDCITLATVNLDSAFATKDCFIRRGPGLWEYHGRLNDILIHSNGEKTNALQMEQEIKDYSKLVKRVAICGSGKPHTSAIIEPDWETVRQSHTTVNQLLVDLQAAVRHANEDAPSHSRVPAHSTHCLLPGVALPVTAKDTIARSKAEEVFAQLLESPQGSFLRDQQAAPIGGGSTGGSTEDPTGKIWTESDLSNAIAKEIAEQIDLSSDQILANGDIPFTEYGVTSQVLAQLQSIVGDILHQNIPPTLPYEYPTLKTFTRACLQTQGPSSQSDQGETPMERLVKSYREAIDEWKATLELLMPLAPAPSPLAKECETTPEVAVEENEGIRRARKATYLLIGASGGLGTELVYYLCNSPRSAKVVCLLRGADPKSRLREAIEERHLTVDWDKIEVHRYDMEDRLMGLSLEDYKRLREEVTDIIHNAWRLNFNMGIDQYAKDCIPSLLHSIKFCTGSPLKKKTLTFVSSISAIGRYAKDDKDLIPEVVVSNPDWVLPFGYAQSKFVAEQIVLYAGDKMDFNVNIVRCGQLSGDRHRGLWNVKDFMSLLVRGGAQELKKMPSSRYPADIVPMDVAAQAICDIVDVTGSPSSAKIYHVANPHGGDWDNFLGLLKQNGMFFDVVEHAEFYEEVKKRPENACYVLLAWLHGDTQASARIRGHLDCTNTLQASSSFWNCPAVDSELIRLYLDQWKAHGFLTQA